MLSAIYFTASWCQPCKVLRPIATKAFEEKGLEYKIYDVDEFETLAGDYHISSVPTIVFIDTEEHRTREINRIVGAHVQTFNRVLDEVTGVSGN